MEFENCHSPDLTTGTGRRRRTTSRIIDFHCHMGVKKAAELAEPHSVLGSEPHSRYVSSETAEVSRLHGKTLKPKLYSVEAKLADMDHMGVDMQVLSPAPTQYYYWADPDLGRETSRLINDGIADVVEANPDRFRGMATLPMQAPELAVAELRRAVRELGMKGVELATNVAGEDLSEAKFSEVFATAEELDVLVFLHPLGFSQGERLSAYHLNNVLGNPFDTSVALSHLIFGGVLDRYPGLKVCAAHGGGFLPTYSGRMDHAYRARPDCRGCKDPPSSYLKRMYFDTLVFNPAQLAYLVRTIGAERLLLGTDYPFDMGESDPVGSVRKAVGLTDDEMQAILSGNAERLLGIAPEASL